MFVDRAVIFVQGGVGGSGSEAFRRETGVPHGGPAGGDGGHGGSVILVADVQLTTLLDVNAGQHYRAERGRHGEGNNRTGRSGVDTVIRVPQGTIVRDVDTEEYLGELLQNGERLVVAKGGRGGRGNTQFKTSTHQAPTYWEPGFEGVERRIELELKLIADVGLVGQPNAGKSTFLRSISEAQPKIADYPFTTLTPNLGVVRLPDFRSLVIADIPGIIEGASEGRGLGLQFLRHIERTRTLAFLIPVDLEDPQIEYDQLREEIRNYSSELALTPHCVVQTKTDLLGPDDSVPELKAPEAWGVFSISAVAHQGLPPLLESLFIQTREEEQRSGDILEEEEWWVPENLPQEEGDEG
jgi:GTP-binding protein